MEEEKAGAAGPRETKLIVKILTLKASKEKKG